MDKPNNALNINILHNYTFAVANLRNRLQQLTLLPQLLAVIAGILIASSVSLEPWLWAAISAVSALLLFASEAIRPIARLLMFASLAAASYATQHFVEVPQGKPLTMDVTIIEEGSLRHSYRSYVAEALCEGFEPFNVEIRTPRTVELRRGDGFVVHSAIKPFTTQPTPYSHRMQQLGFQGVVNIDEGRISNFTSLRYPLLQHRIVDMFSSVAPATQGRAVAMAVGIGYRGEISGDVAGAYIDCGLSHLLAVSGLHVGMMLLFLMVVCRPLSLFWRGFEMQSLALIGLVWLYVWICGLQPSAVRAALLFTLLLLSRIRGRGNAYMLNRLILALIILYIARPALLYDAGLQLSAIAVAAIMLYAVPLIRVLRCRSMLLNDLLAMVVVGTVATLATQPLVALTFGKISFISIFINPIIILLGYASLLGIQLTLAMPGILQEVVASITTASADAMNWLVAWCSSFEVGYATVEITTARVIAIYGAIVVVTLFLAGFRRRKEWNVEDI